MEQKTSYLAILISILLLSTFAFNIPGVSAAFQISLKEHDYYVGDNPFFEFSSFAASLILVESNDTSEGRGYIFVSVNREWLDDKYLRFRWNGYASSTWQFASVLVYDGLYDRSSNTDFPTGSLLSKGNGLLQNITAATKTATFTAETIDTLMDVTSGSEDYCTIFWILNDSQSGEDCNLYLDWVEFNLGAGGTGPLYDEQCGSAITMEQQGDGSYDDYGYTSTGDMEEDFTLSELIDGVFRFFGINDGTTKIWSFLQQLSGYFNDAFTNVTTTITTMWDFITGVSTLIIGTFTDVVDMFLQLSTIVAAILDGTQTGIGTLIDVWTYMGYDGWSEAVPLFMLLAWWLSIDNRYRKTGIGWTSILWNDLAIIMGVTSFIFDWSWRIVNTLIDWLLRLLDFVP